MTYISIDGGIGIVSMITYAGLVFKWNFQLDLKQPPNDKSIECFLIEK